MGAEQLNFPQKVGLRFVRSMISTLPDFQIGNFQKAPLMDFLDKTLSSGSYDFDSTMEVFKAYLSPDDVKKIMANRPNKSTWNFNRILCLSLPTSLLNSNE